MENVIVVRRTEIVFSIKLTPGKKTLNTLCCGTVEKRTERLNIVLVETALDILDHQTCLSYLRVTDHPDLDNHAKEGGQLGRTRSETSTIAHLLRSSPLSVLWDWDC